MELQTSVQIFVAFLKYGCARLRINAKFETLCILILEYSCAKSHQKYIIKESIDVKIEDL